MKQQNIVTIHQPETLPWMGYFNKMMMADTYVILDNVAFRKNYFQNRNQILTRNGPSYLTVPVDGKSNQLIGELKIQNQQKWQKKHIATLKQTYSKSPHFDKYLSFFEKLYSKKFELLKDFNMEIIHYIRDVLNIDTKLVFASDLDVQGASGELLVNICKNVNATHYLSGRDGRNYIDAGIFEDSGIEIVYQEFKIPEYTHFNQDEFHPYMSVFDLLFNQEPAQARDLIEQGYRIYERI